VTGPTGPSFYDLVVTPASGTSYTLSLDDRGDLVQTIGSSAVSVIIPTDASVLFPTGTQILLVQGGEGQLTVTGAVGVTLVSEGNRRKIKSQYGVASLIKLSSNRWLLTGNIVS
jgi:hypothetical protein